MPQIRSIPSVELIANFSEHFWLTDEYWFRAWLDQRNALRMSLLRGSQWVTYIGRDGAMWHAVVHMYPDHGNGDSWILVTPHGRYNSFGQTSFLMTFDEAVRAQMRVDAENQDERNRRRHTGRSADGADRGVAVAVPA